MGKAEMRNSLGGFKAGSQFPIGYGSCQEQMTVAFVKPEAAEDLTTPGHRRAKQFRMIFLIVPDEV